MSKVKIKLNSQGIKEFLRSSQVQTMLNERANRIANKAGGENEVYVAATRAVAKVSGDNTDNNLLKAVR